jgi:membrane protein DedA with SNARE-associated domain
MLTLGYIKHFVSMHADWAYLFVFLGVIIEGEIVVILAGIFSSLGSLNIFIAFVATMAGGGVKSLVGYSLGYYLQDKHSGKSLLRQSEHRINYFLPRYSERPFWSIFVSRFLILGLHWFSVIFAGYKKVKIRTYVEAELSSLLVWSVSVLALGYLFSSTALNISRDIRNFIGIIFLFFIAFFILERIVAFVLEFTGASDDKEN